MYSLESTGRRQTFKQNRLKYMQTDRQSEKGRNGREEEWKKEITTVVQGAVDTGIDPLSTSHQ